MATEITCIVPDSADPGERIDRVGGPGWTKAEDTVIEEIEDGASYFVEVDGQRVDVHVVYDRDPPYLRTDPDRTTDNNLLRLPECPA